jgi:hypothetical protein
MFALPVVLALPFTAVGGWFGSGCERHVFVFRELILS